MTWHLSVLNWLLGFLKDPANGGNSSSRLVSLGGATIMAFYMLADIALRWFVTIACIRDMTTAAAFCTGAGMNENTLIACVGTLGLLGGVVYGTNVVVANKAKPRDQEVLP